MNVATQHISEVSESASVASSRRSRVESARVAGSQGQVGAATASQAEQTQGILKMQIARLKMQLSDSRKNLAISTPKSTVMFSLFLCVNFPKCPYLGCNF